MNRRTLIKTLGISAVGLATVPLWMDGWTVEALPTVDANLNDKQKMILADLVEVIIPATNTPGAKELEVDKYIRAMVADCYEKNVQENFLAGFGELDDVANKKYGKGFLEMSETEKTEISLLLLNKPESQEENFNFLAFVKEMTIAGYMSSEFVLQNIVKYEFVPSRFNGSFPVDQSKIKTA